MLFLENVGENVVCIGDKNLIPGDEPVEVTQAEIDHPMIKAYIKAKKLSRSEVDDEVTDTLSAMTLAQLKEYAAEKQYDITGLTTKADILAKIKELEA